MTIDCKKQAATLYLGEKLKSSIGPQIMLFTFKHFFTLAYYSLRIKILRPQFLQTCEVEGELTGERERGVHCAFVNPEHHTEINKT